MKFLLQEAMNYRKYESPKERLDKMMMALPQDQAVDFKRLMNLVIAKEVTEASSSPTSPPQQPTLEEEATPERPNKRQRTDGTKVDMEGQKNLGKMKETGPN